MLVFENKKKKKTFNYYILSKLINIIFINII